MWILEGHRGPVYALAFSPDGHHLAAVAGFGKEVWLWDLTTGCVSHRWEHRHKVVSLAFAPCTPPLLATCDTLHCIYRCDLTTERAVLIGQLEPATNCPLQAAFAPDGQTLALNGELRPAHGADRWRAICAVTLWRLAEGTPQQTRRLPVGPGASCLAWSPDGTVLAVGSFARCVHLISRVDKKTLHLLQHHAKVHFLAYSPDGRFIVAGTPRGLIRVWETSTGHPHGKLRGQAGQLHALSFSPDASTLASAGQDGTVRLWDVESGRARDGFDWGIGEVFTVAFAADGMRAAAGGKNAIVLWDLDSWV